MEFLRFLVVALTLLFGHAWLIMGAKLPRLLEHQFRAVKVVAVSDQNGTSSGLSSVSTADLVRTLSLTHGVSPESSRQASAVFLLELYQELQHGKDLAQAAGVGRRDPAIKHANTVRSFTAKVPRHEKRNEIRLVFNLSSIPTREVVQKAELRMLPLLGRHARNPRRSRRYRVRVTVTKDDRTVSDSVSRVTVDHRPHEDFLTLDLTRVVQSVLAAGHDTGSVQISVRRRRSRRDTRLHLVPALSDVSDKNAMLVLFSLDHAFFRKLQKHALGVRASSESASARVARAAGKKDRGRKKKRRGRSRRCRTHDLLIDFDQIGWGKWIVYPKRYNAFYCGGRCRSPVTWEMDPTNHAVLQSLVRLKNRKKVPQPCCVPTRLRPISMLYYERDEIVVRHHENMIVDRCGCR
ncbi:hypothetical protein NP493_35g04047 [Ridgeia piscesae]|uniref:TGF-beta family profile domain-containing protein n=1 Tax=Ridgeia piscesae TaxID=27915 RepID=A0AAD9PCR0_RIDPI|nr:hypothetical protein NP493_35g04047 [Ridgeia piscesae]